MSEPTSIQTLRWVFSRAGETLNCELSLDANALLYELRVVRSDATGTFSEQFRDVAKAFDRQCQLEASLLREGWSLDSYLSGKIEI